MALSNSQYNAIMRIYGQKQIQNKHEQDRRVQEVYSRIPQIPQLEAEISSRAVECAKKLLDGDLTARTGLKEQIEDLRETEAGTFKSMWLRPGLSGYALHLSGLSGYRIHWREKMSLFPKRADETFVCPVQH